MVICLQRGADLHMFQLMSLPLTVSCFSKIQIGFAFLVPAHLGSPRKRAVKCVCVCVCVLAVVLFELCCVNVTLYSFPVVTDHIAVRPVLISVGLTYFLLAHFTTMHACVCVVGLCVGHADAEQVIRLQDTSSECRRCRVG